MLTPNLRPCFHYNVDDNQRVEPEWYLPIIPTVLVNGAEGIGTAWASKIPNYDVREIVGNIHRMLNGDEPRPMLPSYKGFKGTIEQVMDNQFINTGEVAIIDSTTIEISELPVKTWTQVYKENVLEPMLNGTEKVPPLITDYKEYHTDTTLSEAEAAGLHKVFKLQQTLTCNSMVTAATHMNISNAKEKKDELSVFCFLEYMMTNNASPHHTHEENMQRHTVRFTSFTKNQKLARDVQSITCSFGAGEGIQFIKNKTPEKLCLHKYSTLLYSSNRNFLIL
uniref:Topo IIA-type catalytic domain-containing protein n=1 Tax=Cyclopterus lumpus TaxID=8103 RepID=A0A8C2X6D3_CYCLU